MRSITGEEIRRHTPGPWSVGDEAKSESPLMVYCDDSLGSRVADLSTSGHGISTQQDRANALLIAAAPDMVDAIRAALDCWDCEGLLTDAVVMQMRRAAAKSELG